MSESASALFSIADAGEFRFARFYIVCEEVPLGAPESPPIVSGVTDMHPSDCPNVEETRNSMQTFSWKKCSHFSQPNFHLHFHMKSPSVFLIISLKSAQSTICFLRQVPFLATLQPVFFLISVYWRSLVAGLERMAVRRCRRLMAPSTLFCLSSRNTHSSARR